MPVYSEYVSKADLKIYMPLIFKHQHLQIPGPIFKMTKSCDMAVIDQMGRQGSVLQEKPLMDEGKMQDIDTLNLPRNHIFYLKRPKR